MIEQQTATATATDRFLADASQVVQWSLDVIKSGQLLQVQHPDDARSYRFSYDAQLDEVSISTYKEGDYKGTDHELTTQWTEIVDRYDLVTAYNSGTLNLSPQAEPQIQAGDFLQVSSMAEASLLDPAVVGYAPSFVQNTPQTQAQGEATMSTEVVESTQTEPKKLDGRTKEGKAAKKAAQEAVQAQPVAEAPVADTPTDLTSIDLSAADITEVINNSIEQEVEQTQLSVAESPVAESSQAESQQSEQESPSYDVGMSMFANGNGANLFAKPEHQAVMEQVAAEMGLEVKMSNPKVREDGTQPEPKPYISVKGADQIQTAMDKLGAAGLNVADNREAFKERREKAQEAKSEARREAYVEKKQQERELRFEGAGSFAILAMQKCLEAGKTIVSGKELSFYQTKRSQERPDQAPEYAVYDQRTKTTIAQATIDRDSKTGKIKLDVSVDRIAQANAERPAEGAKIKPPTRDQMLESLGETIKAKVAAKQAPVLKKNQAAKSADDGR